MDGTTKSIIDSITVTYDEPQPIPGGQLSKTFYDCIQLNPNDLARLAAEAVGHLSEDAFDLVLGVAYRGILFASAVAGGRKVVIQQADGQLVGPSIDGKRVIVVGDVVRSGRQLFEAEEAATFAGGTVVGYACIVDRSNGKVGAEEKPLWSACATDFS